MRSAIALIRFILAKYLSGQKFSVAILLSIVLVSSGLSVAAPYFFSRQIDSFTNGVFNGLIGIFWIYASLLGLSVAFQRGSQYFSIVHAERLGFLASTLFFERLVNKKPAFFVDHNPVEIQSAQSQGTQALIVLVQVMFDALLPSAMSFVLAILLLGATISVEIVIVVLAYGAAFLILIIAANRLTRHFMDDAINSSQESARFVGNAIATIEPLRQTGSTGWMKQRFIEGAESVFHNWRAYALRRIGFGAAIGALVTVQFGITFVLLLPKYEAGALSVGDIILFNALLLQLNVPFELIGQSIDETLRAITRIGPFARMWLDEEEPAEASDPVSLKGGTVEFCGVAYQYPNGRGIQNISFKAQRGRITFIIGETGSGKSTLLKLLLKTIEPDSGRVWIDDADLRSIPRPAWFGAIGIVPQEILLLNDTLRTNITLGRPLDDARLRDAARKAAILERIEEMPAGFETTVGERGLKLSGGERQRVAIARALYSEPSILLLDEASSALDEATEIGIMAHLRAVAEEVTIIAITHRQNSIEPDDQTVILKVPDIGAIAEF